MPIKPLKMKKIFIIIIAALSLALAAPAEVIIHDGIYYETLTDNTVKVISETEGGGGSSISIGFGGGYEGDVVIPASFTENGVEYTVTGVGGGAFAYCDKLTSVTLPTTITAIAEGSFAADPQLAFIDVPEENTYYCTVDGVLYTHDKTLFLACPGATTGEFVVPESVTVLARSAFNGCASLTKITLPQSLAYISANAFSGCSALKEVNIPDEINIIEDGTFYGCRKLSSVTLPPTVTSIGELAFYYCQSLNQLAIPSTVTTISDKAFEDCSSLQKIELPEGLTSIGSRAFANCTLLPTIFIPANVSSIGDAPFTGCSWLTDIDVDRANEHYASVDGVLFNHDITLLITCPQRKSGTYTIPATVTKIGDSGFNLCRYLTDITLPAQLDTISKSAFKGCSKLTELELPATLKYIGTSAYANCSNIERITCFAIACPVIEQSTFSTAMNGKPLYVPGHYRTQYTKNTLWKKFKNINAIVEEVEVEAEEVKPGTPTTLTLSALHAERVMKGFTFSFSLPDDVTLLTDEEGTPQYTLSDHFGSTPSVTFTSTDDGIWTMNITMDGVSSMTDNEGDIATLQYTTSADLETGTYEGELTNAIFSCIHSDNTIATNQPFTISVRHMLGDVNHDGFINIYDVTLMIDYILGLDTTNFHVAEADINNDSFVNIYDVTMIIDIILNK